MPRSCYVPLALTLLAGCVLPPPARQPLGVEGPYRAPNVAYRAPNVVNVVERPGPPPRPTAFGDTIRNPIVRDIQRQLRRHGYYAGPTDGIDTPETIAAIQNFQARHRLPPDGSASPYLLSVLRNTPPGA